MRLLNLDGMGWDSLAPTPVVKYHLDGLPLPYEGSHTLYGSYDGFPSSYGSYGYDGLPLSIIMMVFLYPMDIL